MDCLMVIQLAVFLCLHHNSRISAFQVFNSLKQEIPIDQIEAILEAYFELGGVSKSTDQEGVTYSVFSSLDGEKMVCFPDGAILYAKSPEQANEYKKAIRPKIESAQFLCRYGYHQL